ncbi:glycosyltransferase family 4 protein [Halorubrum sp. LN27]|uniref:glycosyltransferase family 4 protein n=1 Tax=Halorubrum sp. LN27 TaxID=2801032 RepID=UPI00190C72FE|nr:glycosyltransferase family 4 protein [Halorubrum sp. LN27]
MAKVTILTSSHSTFDTRIFHKEARSLTNAGYDVTLITPHHVNTVRDGISVKAVGNKDVDSANFRHTREIYHEALNIDADVYHLHDPGLLPFGFMLSVKTDAKIIYDCHEDYGRALRFYDSVPLNPVSSRVFPPVQSAITKRFDAVVAATDWIAEDFRRRGHNEVTLVRNFPRISLAAGGNVDMEGDYQYRLVYVGNLSEERGLTKMLRITEELHERGVDVGLVLIGRITEAAAKVIDEFRDQRGLKNRVKACGYIEPDEIYPYLRAADIGLCMLERARAEYIIPTKMFEYMLSELPVVATETEGTKRYLPEDCGRVVSEDTTKQVDAIAEILADEELLMRMGKNGRKRVEQEYCWEVEQDQLLSLYSRLLD